MLYVKLYTLLVRLDAEDPQRGVLPPLLCGGVEVLPAVVHVVRAVRVVVADVPDNGALTITCHVSSSTCPHLTVPFSASTSVATIHRVMPNTGLLQCNY